MSLMLFLNEWGAVNGPDRSDHRKVLRLYDVSPPTSRASRPPNLIPNVLPFLSGMQDVRNTAVNHMKELKQ